MHHRLWVSVAVSFLVVSPLGESAQAQSPPNEVLAEQLFEEAVALRQAGRWREAYLKFEASLRHDPGVGTQLNLAVCSEHIGELVRAREQYRQAIALGDVEQRALAERHLADLDRRIPVVTIAAPAHPPPHFVVTWNGTELDAAALKTRRSVDPGTYVVTARAPGLASFQQTVTLHERETRDIALPNLDAWPRAAPAKISTTPQDLALFAGAVGLTAVVTGLAFGWSAHSLSDEAKRTCGGDLTCGTDEIGHADVLTEEARSKAKKSTVLILGGGAAITIAAVVLLKLPAKRERAARIVPVLHERGTGLAVLGRF